MTCLFSAEDEGLEPTHPFTDVRFSKPLHYHSANLPKKNLGLVPQDFAEGVGFEPTEQFPVLQISSLTQSTNSAILPILIFSFYYPFYFYR